MSLCADNTPLFTPETRSAWQEVWYMKLNATHPWRALWLRFTVLVRADGSKRIAETWALSFSRGGDDTVTKAGFKNTYPIEQFVNDGDGFHIDTCHFSDEHTHGEVRGADASIRWDLRMESGGQPAFDFVPRSFKRLGVKNRALTVFEDFRFTGWSEVNGVRSEWKAAPGMQGHLSGPKNGHSWAWAHCGMFHDEQGEPFPCIFDGLSARARLGKRRSSPLLTVTCVEFEGQRHVQDGLWRALRSPSEYDATGWRFEVCNGPWRFVGNIHANVDDFAGATYEDTDGKNLYCHNSKVSDMSLDVFHRAEKLRSLNACGTAAYEFVTRSPHPDVAFLV